MRRFALASVSVLLLSYSHFLHSAGPSSQPVSIGNFQVSDERCVVAIALVDDRWNVVLTCPGDEKRTAIFRENVLTATLWLLLGDGKAANPIRPIGAGQTMGLVVCMGGGCSYSADADFEDSGDPTAVVLRYQDEFHVFPVTKGLLDKVKGP